MDHKDWQWTDAVAQVGVACCRDGSMGVAGVKAPANNQISDVNYSIVSHRPQCRWAAYLSSDQSETSADLSSGHFSHNALAVTELMKRQQAMAITGENGQPLKLTQRIKTRWNSVFDMFQRLVKLQLSITLGLLLVLYSS